MKLVKNLHKESVYGYYYLKAQINKFKCVYTITPDTYREICKDTNGNQFEHLGEVVDSKVFTVYKFDSRKEYEKFISKKSLIDKLRK